MKKGTKTRQIMVRYDDRSYDRISACAEREHRGLSEFVRHATLSYIENFDKEIVLEKETLFDGILKK